MYLISLAPSGSEAWAGQFEGEREDLQHQSAVASLGSLIL